jgi:hypothetical protein
MNQLNYKVLNPFIIYFIFLSLPILSLFNYVISSLLGIEIKDISAYLRLIIIIIIILINRRNVLYYLFLLLYLALYILFTRNPYTISARANFMISFVCFIALAKFVTDNNIIISSTSKSHTKKSPDIAIHVFFITSIIVSLINGMTDKWGRIYLNSFLSAHNLGYILVAFSYYFLIIKKNQIGFLYILFSIILGSRTVILTALITIIVYFKGRKLKEMIPSLTIILIFGLLSLYFFNDVIKNQIEYYSSNLNLLKNFGYKDKEVLASFTSIRSLVFENMVAGMKKWSFVDYIIGNGPLSSLAYNKKTLGYEIWMHNDFLDTFYSYGLFGIFLYLYSLIKIIKIKNYRAIGVLIITAALTNGFYTYYPEMYLSLIVFSSQNILKYRKTVQFQTQYTT